MRISVQKRVNAERAAADPRSELKKYLSAPLDEFCGGNIVDWWQDHQFEYPIWSHMARDYLAIPGSSVPSERAFSSGRHIGTEFRNSLSTDTFEALQILKSGYKQGIISAAIEIAEVEKLVHDVTEGQ